MSRFPLRVPMRSRDVAEPHRASSGLELLFDLTFVIAVASITTQLAEAIGTGRAGAAVVPFLAVFFAIWWAWMNFTWFASAFDTDDVPHRLFTMLQMAGALLLAAGVPSAFEHGDFLAVTLGYLVMRIGLVAGWLRAAIEDAGARRTALRYAAGVSLVQVGWLLRLPLIASGVIPEAAAPYAFAVLVVLELAVPPWAERAGATAWHPHHIADRYGGFVIIVLGESVLAASNGVAAALRSGGLSAGLVVVALSALVLLFSLWWIYSLHPSGEGLAANRRMSFVWGYAHYAVFAALAALGAGLEVAVAQTGHHLTVDAAVAAWAVALPTAVFLLLVWLAHAPFAIGGLSPWVMAAAVALTIATPFAAGLLGAVGACATLAGIAALTVAVSLLLPSMR